MAISTPFLTIRNLTSNPIALKLVERFESLENGNGGGIYGITRKLSGLVSNITSPSSPQLALKAESFSSHDVSVLIEPFATKCTEVESTGKGVLRMTFEADGQRYRLDTPCQRSTHLTPLSPNPQLEFTAVFLPQSSFLALYSSAKLESWMSRLRNETPLSALSIPGTHNSPTYHAALPSVRCQSVGVRDQLNNGVRFLDIRVQPVDANDVSKEGLILVHSAFPVALTGARYFRDLINVVHSFLEENPTETVIISLKREGIGRSTDQHLSKILKTHYATDPNRWFTDNRIPTLGEARTKIVLMRRFTLDDSLKGENNGTGWAIDAESWPDNCADGVCTSGEIRIQDFYEVAESVNIDKKITYSTDQLERAAKTRCTLPHNNDVEAANEAAKQPFFMNFLSASNFWRANCWPDRIAAKVNPRIVDYLCRRHNEKEHHEVGDGSTGIVVCDWVGIGGDWDLVRCIVGMNAKLEVR